MLTEEGFKPAVYWDKTEDDDENQFEPGNTGGAEAGWLAYIVAAK